MKKRNNSLSREISKYEYLIEMPTEELKKLIQKDCFDGEEGNMDDTFIEMILEIIMKREKDNSHEMDVAALWENFKEEYAAEHSYLLSDPK